VTMPSVNERVTALNVYRLPKVTTSPRGRSQSVFLISTLPPTQPSPIVSLNGDVVEFGRGFSQAGAIELDGRIVPGKSAYTRLWSVTLSDHPRQFAVSPDESV